MRMSFILGLALLIFSVVLEGAETIKVSDDFPVSKITLKFSEYTFIIRVSANSDL